MSINIKRIEFWIVVFFLIRLIGITNAPLEISHSWRQATGLMVARNFLEIDNNILYPRIDDNHATTGIIGMEFPIMNYLYYILAKIFGWSHWYGRLINLVVSSIGIYYFSKIVQRFFTKEVSFFSSLALLASIWFSFSRKMMPDTFCISLMFIGIYYGIKYLEWGKVWHLILYLLFSGLGILSKIPAGIYFVIIILLLFQNFKPQRKFLLSALTIIPLALTYWWYFNWNPYLSSQFGSWYNNGKSISEGFKELISHWDSTLKNFYFNAFEGYLFFVIFAVGILLAIKNRQKKLLIIFLSVGIVFLVYMSKSGFFFYHHSYYIIPFVPVMALVIGYAISKIQNSKLLVFFVLIATLESVLNQQHDFFIKDSREYLMQLEKVADKTSSPDDLIVINGGGSPLQIYLAHRKGWTCENEQLADPGYLANLKKKGCKYVFINKEQGKVNFATSPMYSDQYFEVYSFTELLAK